MNNKKKVNENIKRLELKNFTDMSEVVKTKGIKMHTWEKVSKSSNPQSKGRKWKNNYY